MTRDNRMYASIGLLLTIVILPGCVTSRIEDVRESNTGIAEGEGVVIMAKSYHLGNETEAGFITCVGDAVGRGSNGLRVISNSEFVDALFPWFEPRTAPPATRLKYIQALSQLGIPTTARLDPLIPGLTDTRTNLIPLLRALRQEIGRAHV